MAGPPVLKPNPVRPVPEPLNSPARQVQPKEVLRPDPLPMPGWRRGFRAAVPWVLAVLLTCVVLQIGMGAAAAVGGDYGYIPAHGAMAGILHLVPLVLILFAALGKDWPALAAGATVLVLVTIQFPLLELEGALRGLHVLNALVVFTVTLLTMHARIPWTRRARPAAPA